MSEKCQKRTHAAQQHEVYSVTPEASRCGCWGRADRLLFLLGRGAGGAVACVPSLIASGAPLLTPLCASRASFLSPFRSPASPFLSPLGARLCRVCRRSRRRSGGRGGGLGFSLRHRQKRRRGDQSKYRRASKESERAATTDLFRLRTFTHFHAPGLLPCQSMSFHLERLVIDLDQLGLAFQATPEFPLTGLILSAGAG
jgi:hypothetical protein